MPVKVAGVTKHFLSVAALIAVAVLVARPAAAQFSLGSPGGPPRLELGAGAFDITPSHRPYAGTQGDFRGEYHFGDMLWIISPMVGLDVTTTGGTYLYGWYQHGSGTVLGSWFEFRTGAELDYKFDDQSRLGIAVHHISNAGLTKVNPGEQSILLVYQLPLHW
jgi:lipid A 3-O-deacylase